MTNEKIDAEAQKQFPNDTSYQCAFILGVQYYLKTHPWQRGYLVGLFAGVAWGTVIYILFK